MHVLGGLIGLIVFGSVILALAIPLLILWAIVEVVRNLAGGGRRGDRYDPAAAALRYRYARGEITQTEFETGMHSLGYVRR